MGEGVEEEAAVMRVREGEAAVVSLISR